MPWFMGLFWDYFNIIPIHLYVQSSLAERTLFQCRLAYFENFQQCLRHPLLSLKVHLSFCLCAFQVSEQFESPSEAASSVGQLQPERRPHGSRALQGGDRHCRAHTSRYHIHHPVCLHLLLHTWVQLSAFFAPLFLFSAPFSPGICKAMGFYTHVFCAIVRAHVRYYAKVVPVWWEDYPRTGTLHTFVRMHPANPQQPASTNMTTAPMPNSMGSNQDQTGNLKRLTVYILNFKEILNIIKMIVIWWHIYFNLKGIFKINKKL